MSELVINVSRHVSLLCYSVFRVEPFTSCDHNCLYCYAKWYRSGGKARPRLRGVMEFKAAAKRLSGKRIIPFRLATLSDPFQPRERRDKLSRLVMKIALQRKVPLIISTKSALMTEPSWMSIASKLADKGLLVLQVSLSTLRRDVWEKLEPNAPPPEERLKLIEAASKEGVPVVARLQPAIPGVTDVEARELCEQVKAAGARQVIAEVLRCSPDEMEVIKSISIDRSAYSIEWTPYTKTPRPDGPPLYRPPLFIRLRVLEAIRNAAVRAGLFFACCKEGLFHLDTAPDCCGMHFLESYALRLTLREAWKLSLDSKKPVSFNEVLRAVEENDLYLAGSKLDELPIPLSKPLKAHEKRVERSFCDGSASEEAPLLDMAGEGYVRARLSL